MTFHVSLASRRNLSGEIHRQLRRAILDGRFRPGDRLPATRELARTLAVSRMTVTEAYDRLVSEGFVTPRVGAGTFVSNHVIKRNAVSRTDGVLRPRAIWQSVALPTVFDHSARFDFRTGVPDASLFPHRSWRRTVTRALQSPDAQQAIYRDPAGHPQLRAAIACHIAIARGVNASPDDVCVTNGTQQALDVLARVLFEPGDRVAVEDPGYPLPVRLFSSLGIRVIPVPVDREGLIVDAIPRQVRAVYVTPSHQYPLGVSMTLTRRQALLAWADRHQAAIIEDDYDSEFRFGGRPLDALQTLDGAGRVVYVGSFSKTLLPGLRLGFVVTPPSLRTAVHKAKLVADWHTPTLGQGALAEFLDSGNFARHVRHAGAVYRERHELIVNTLARDFAVHLDVLPSVSGLHLTALARKASSGRVATILDRAQQIGVAAQNLSHFVLKTQMAGVVLGYGAIRTADIEEGLRRFRTCFPA